MHEVVISDTSCLILLNKIRQLDILRNLYARVIVTSKIAEEYGESLPEWIEVKDSTNPDLITTLSKWIDPGEASAFALMFELKNCTLILDDRKARQVAISLGFSVTGTLGVLIKAKKEKKIDKIKPLIDQLMKTDFRFDKKLIAKVLQQAGEL